MIARLAPIKEDTYETKLGPGSYDPIKPSMSSVAGGASVWGKSKDKRKMWNESNDDQKYSNTASIFKTEQHSVEVYEGREYDYHTFSSL